MPHAGVVHDPNTGFITWAARGQGAVAGSQTIVLAEQPLTEASNVAVRVPVDPNLAAGAITDPRGRPLFPPAAEAYRGAPMPLLGGNPTAHAQALADCRPVLDASPAEAP